MWLFSASLVFIQILLLPLEVSAVVPQILNLNVQCEKTGMTVQVEFDSPFNGIIFSKGFYDNANCRYVPANSGRDNYAFVVPMAGCGTVSTEDVAGDGTIGFRNILIIQNDAQFQEIWDSARKVSCDWVTRIDKIVTFNPFMVDMLDVIEVSSLGDQIDCWMDVQVGRGPFAPQISGVVQIGETLTIVIYIRDADGSFDVHVKDCYAYDTPEFDSPETKRIQLTDENGCTVKEKLLESFYRTRDTRNSGASIIAYGYLSAFRFPDKLDVFLTCNVEVCKGSCDNPCQPEQAAESRQQSRVDLSVKARATQKPISSTLLSVSTTTPTKSSSSSTRPVTNRINRPTFRRTPASSTNSQTTAGASFSTASTTTTEASRVPLPQEQVEIIAPIPRSHKSKVFHSYHHELGRFKTRIGGRRKRRDAIDHLNVIHINGTATHMVKSFAVIAPNDVPGFNEEYFERLRDRLRYEDVCMSMASFVSAVTSFIIMLMIGFLALLITCLRKRNVSKTRVITTDSDVITK